MDVLDDSHVHVAERAVAKRIAAQIDAGRAQPAVTVGRLVPVQVDSRQWVYGRCRRDPSNARPAYIEWQSHDRVRGELVRDVLVGGSVLGAKIEWIVIRNPNGAALVVVVGERARPGIEGVPLETCAGTVLGGYAQTAVKRTRGRFPHGERPEGRDRPRASVDVRDSRRVVSVDHGQREVKVPIALQVNRVDVMELGPEYEPGSDFAVNPGGEGYRARVPVVIRHSERLRTEEGVGRAAGHLANLFRGEDGHCVKRVLIEVDSGGEELLIDRSSGGRERQ